MSRRKNVSRSTKTLAILLVLSAIPIGVRAAELEVDHDARLEGYDSNIKVVMDDSNLTLPWLGFGFISAVALLGMFKDAKRSHLD